MTNVLFRIVRISRSQFKCSYLTNKKTFSELSVPFHKFTSNFEYFEKNEDRHRECISEITDCK